MNFLEIKNKIQTSGFGIVRPDYYASKLSSMGTGGRVSALIKADTLNGLIEILNMLDSYDIEYMILGSGTNTVFPDRDIEMAVIKLGRDFGHSSFEADGTIHTGAASKTNVLVMEAARQGHDLSPLAGIPGTVAGAVSGNSGTGSWGICDSIVTVNAILKYNNKIVHDNIDSANIEAGYRYFKLDNLIAITGLVLKVPKDKPDNILAAVKRDLYKRKTSQPINAKTCGCFFKNPSGIRLSAGEMIDQCGMKGFIYGGARVSVIHANFIENYRNATSEDVKVLSRIIKDKVKDKFNIKLDYEVKMIG